jgi:predicted DNA-binding transcriptional regulator YafY
MDQLIIEMPSWANTSKQKKMVKEIRYAIAQQNVITINYRDYQNQTTLRSIEPISIIFKGYSWHLFAYCLLRNDYRVFRISRIQALEIESENFTSRGLSYHDFESNSHHKESISITLKFMPSVRSRVEDIFENHIIQFLKSGEIVVTAQFPDIEWCYSLILSFGEAVEVLGPNSVRNAIANRVKDMYEKYF